MAAEDLDIIQLEADLMHDCHGPGDPDCGLADCNKGSYS